MTSKNFIFFILVVFIFSCSDDSEDNTNNDFVGGILQGGISLRTQEEVDEFVKKGYTGMTAALFLLEEPTPANPLEDRDPIVDISGLSTLTSIGGDLRIEQTDISSLNGLNNVESIGGFMLLFGNPLLTSMQGFQSLGSVDEILIANNGLTDLSGLEGITSLEGDLVIGGLDGITDLRGLDNLQKVGNLLRIEGCNNLLSLNGLENLSMTDNLALNSLSSDTQHFIAFNDNLNDLCGITNFMVNNPEIKIIFTGNGEPITKEQIIDGICRP